MTDVVQIEHHIDHQKALKFISKTPKHGDKSFESSSLENNCQALNINDIQEINEYFLKIRNQRKG
jgi:hypothetical protein